MYLKYFVIMDKMANARKGQWMQTKIEFLWTSMSSKGIELRKGIMMKFGDLKMRRNRQ